MLKALSLSLILVIASLATAWAQPICNTTIPGGSVFGGSWTEAGSPYCVTDNLAVGGLSVDPGVRVYVDGPFAITVLSSITAIGTSAKPILFSAYLPGPPDNQRWKGFKFGSGTGGSNFTYATIEYSDDGAITLTDADAPLLNQCDVRNNSRVGEGGAIQGTGVTSNMTITNSLIRNNTSTSHGGALSVDFATGLSLSVDNTAFLNNTANPAQATGEFFGGALYLSDDPVEISSSQFSGNRANSQCTAGFECHVTAKGGAIYIESATGVEIRASVISGNRTDALNLGNCFFGGTANSFGAGIFVASGGVSIENSILSCNETTRTNCELHAGGTGVYVETGSATISNATVARNPAAVGGTDATGFELISGSMSVTNSIVFANNAGGNQISGTPTVTYSDVQTPGPSAYPGTGNIRNDPIFQASSGCSEFELLPAFISPTIDAGNLDSSFNDACLPPGQDTAANDMGAFGGPGNCTHLPEPGGLTLLGPGTACILWLSKRSRRRAVRGAC